MRPATGLTLAHHEQATARLRLPQLLQILPSLVFVHSFGSGRPQSAHRGRTTALAPAATRRWAKRVETFGDHGDPEVRAPGCASKWARRRWSSAVEGAAAPTAATMTSRSSCGSTDTTISRTRPVASSAWHARHPSLVLALGPN